MFENWSYEALQIYWWVVVSVVGALFVFMMFVQGGQTMLGVAKDEDEKTLLVNALGKKWELTFTTLVLFGGALFAAFPLFYSVSFGGAYAVWMAILFSFTLQAISYEYRKKENNFWGSKVYEGFMYFNGTVGTVLVVAAIATFFSGSLFYVNSYNLSAWQSPLRGLEAAFVPFNLSMAFAVFFLTRINAAAYFVSHIEHAPLEARVRKSALKSTLASLPFLLFFLVSLLTMDGFAIGVDKVISMQPYAYLNALLSLGVFGIGLLALGTALIVAGIYLLVFTNSKRAIFATGLGTVLTTLSLLFAAGIGGSPYYPSMYNLQSSLTIFNSSGSRYTLVVMSYVSLLVPFVLSYIVYVWKLMDSKKLSLDSIKNEHLY
jgi:cytochrome d ubiquinol oxidase subunit II